MEHGAAKRKGRRGIIVMAVVFAGIAGLIGGAVGGAAGAMWVVETMANPQYSPKVRNTVIKYDMPGEGARPVDIAGIQKNGTPLHPCFIDFLEGPAAEILPHADWTKVRLSPYFKSEGDIITEMAFARGAVAITRQNDIIVRVPHTRQILSSLNERLMFHELVHVDQYASGTMDLPDYAASSARAYANGRDPQENFYEREADLQAEMLLNLWVESDARKVCHKDVTASTRASSEKPEITYALFDLESQQYRVVETRLHDQ